MGDALIWTTAMGRLFLEPGYYCNNIVTVQNAGYLGPVARSLVSANRWLRGIKMYRFSWYLTLVSTNHASSKLGLEFKFHTDC